MRVFLMAAVLGLAACAPAATAPVEPNPAPAHGQTGGICGGIAGFACHSPRDYCHMPTGQCRMPDAAGTCTPMRPACTREYRPVCGCDGKTYGNACTAAATGVSVASEGECVPSP